jgi:hypothetical protein
MKRREENVRGGEIFHNSLSYSFTAKIMADILITANYFFFIYNLNQQSEFTFYKLML